MFSVTFVTLLLRWLKGSDDNLSRVCHYYLSFNVSDGERYYLPGYHCAGVERAVRYLIIVSGSFVVTNHHWLGFMSLVSGDGDSHIPPPLP